MTPKQGWHHADGYLQKKLFSAFKKHLSLAASNTRISKVVDLGCGNRPYETLVRSLNFTYTGADISADPDASVRPEVRLFEGQPSDLADKCSRVVLSTQVLEHVWSIDWYLDECRRLLEDDGLLILSTHGTWPYHPHPTDFRRWTRSGLCREINERGFEVMDVESIMGPGAWMIQFMVLMLHKVNQKLPPQFRFIFAIVFYVANTIMAVVDGITPIQIHDDNAAVYVVVAKKSKT